MADSPFYTITRVLLRTPLGLLDRRPGALGHIGVGSDDAVRVVARPLVGIGQRIDRLGYDREDCAGGWRIFVRGLRRGARPLVRFAKQQQTDVAAPHAAGWVAAAQGRQHRAQPTRRLWATQAG